MAKFRIFVLICQLFALGTSEKPPSAASTASLPCRRIGNTTPASTPCFLAYGGFAEGSLGGVHITISSQPANFAGIASISTVDGNGALPPGMNFNLLRNAASINGIPTVAGNYKFSVSVTDGRKTFVFPISFLVQADNDHDSVPDVQDNCQALPNADQADNDHDGIGNLCDTPYFTVQAQDSMISENSLLTVNFQVRDPNSEHLTVNAILPSGVAEGLVSPIEATIDSNGLGVVKIKPSWAFVQHPATGRNCCFSRDFDVTLVVSDGGEEIQDSFRVTVTDFLGFTVVRVSWFGGWGLCSEYTI